MLCTVAIQLVSVKNTNNAPCTNVFVCQKHAIQIVMRSNNMHFQSFDFSHSEFMNYVCITKCSWLAWNSRKLVKFSEMDVYSLRCEYFLFFSSFDFAPKEKKKNTHTHCSHGIPVLFIFFWHHKWICVTQHSLGETRAFCLVNVHDL